jgi:hypothetical protein
MCARLGHEVAQCRLETALRVEDALSEVSVRHCDRSSTSLGTLAVAPVIWPELAAERGQAARASAVTSRCWRWGGGAPGLTLGQAEQLSRHLVEGSNVCRIDASLRTARASFGGSRRRYQARSSMCGQRVAVYGRLSRHYVCLGPALGKAGVAPVISSVWDEGGSTIHRKCSTGEIWSAPVSVGCSMALVRRAALCW